MRHQALLVAAIALAGCATGIGDAMRASAERERACRGAYSERLGLPMSTIEIGRASAGTTGGATLSMQTVDGLDRATCRVGPDGGVLDITPAG